MPFIGDVEEGSQPYIRNVNVEWMVERINRIDRMQLEGQLEASIPLIKEGIEKAVRWTDIEHFENILYDLWGDAEKALGNDEAAEAAWNKAKECRERDNAVES